MEASQIYLLIAIVALLLIGIGLFIFSKKKKKPTLTPLTSLAFGCVLAGIIFDDNRIVAYSLMGIGILLAVIDIIIKMRKKKK